MSLTERLDRACLRRDAYLDRVLEAELPQIEQELTVANSPAARAFIADRLDRLDRKAVTLTLREDLLARLDAILEARGVIRDAFWNRLFYMLAATSERIDWMFFLGDSDWRQHVWAEYKNEGPSYRNLFSPLDPDIDPFWALRVALSDIRDVRASPPQLIYTTPFTDGTFPPRKDGTRVDLHGLNCWLPDEFVPGTDEHAKAAVSLDDLLE